MKVKIEVEIKDSTADDLQAMLVLELYEKCQSWINDEEIPYIEFTCDDDECEEIPKSYSDFHWIWDKNKGPEIN